MDFADLNKTYDMLNEHLSQVPEFKDVKDSKSITAISLAKYFLQKFSYLPLSSLKYIKCNNITNNIEAFKKKVGRPKKQYINENLIKNKILVSKKRLGQQIRINIANQIKNQLRSPVA